MCGKLDDVINDKYKSYSAYSILKDLYYEYKVDNVDDIKNGKPIIDSNLNKEYI